MDLKGLARRQVFFITYHSDLSDAIPMATTFLFADDVAATMAGQVGLKYCNQCVDLERRLDTFFDDLEYYYLLAVQPINYNKTQAMWSIRAIKYPNPISLLKCNANFIGWTNKYKYFGYWITTKLGWSTLIGQSLIKIRQRTALVNSCRFAGASSIKARRILFSAFVYPLFAWFFALIPLFTWRQQSDLSHVYFTCLRRTYRCLHWEHFIFAVLYKGSTNKFGVLVSEIPAFIVGIYYKLNYSQETLFYLHDPISTMMLWSSICLSVVVYRWVHVCIHICVIVHDLKEKESQKWV